MRVVIALWLLSFASVAAASPPPPPPEIAEAKRHFQSGMAHFNLQEYRQAIVDFEAGYRLHPDAVFLYNLAQAHRLADNAERALYFYHAYLRVLPGAENRAEVEGRVQSLEAAMAEKERSRQSAPAATDATARKTAVASPAANASSAPDTVVPSTTAAVPHAVDDRRPAVGAHTAAKPLYKQWWLWTVVGVAAAGAAVGVAVGVTTSHGATFNANLGTYGPSLTVQF